MAVLVLEDCGEERRITVLCARAGSSRHAGGAEEVCLGGSKEAAGGHLCSGRRPRLLAVLGVRVGRSRLTFLLAVAVLTAGPS